MSASEDHAATDTMFKMGTPSFKMAKAMMNRTVALNKNSPTNLATDAISVFNSNSFFQIGTTQYAKRWAPASRSCQGGLQQLAQPQIKVRFPFHFPTLRTILFKKCRASNLLARFLSHCFAKPSF